jgi:uncharacterized protein
MCGLRLNRVLTASFLMTFILFGCGTNPTVHYYTLNSINPPQTLLTGEGGDIRCGDSRCTVGIGPVDIPDYLERPHIVARSSENEAVVAEYDRWAGSLKQDVTRVLIENVSYHLPAGTPVLSWKRNIPMDYRVAVDITRLDIAPGRAVVMGAQWAVFLKDKKAPQVLQNQRFTETVASRDYGEIVSAINRIMLQLSGEIAAGVLHVRGGEGKKRS